MYTLGTLVIIRNSARDAIKGQKMGKRWCGLYKVVEHKGKGVYKVQSVRTGKVLKKVFNACRLKAWRVRKPQVQCKPPPITPPLLEGSMIQYASEDDSVTITPHQKAIFHSPNSFLVSPPSDQSLSLSVPAQGPNMPPRCSTPFNQQSKSPAGGHSDNPISVSGGSGDSVFLGYWVKDLCLTDQDRESLVNGEWLNDKQVNAANELLRIKHPTINGLQDPLVLAYNCVYRSGSQRFVQIINIAQSHWICASNMLSPPGVVEVYDSMPSYSVHSSNLTRQVAAILQTPQADFELRHVDVQRQVGGSDCGLFALAFATALCSDLA